MSAIPLPRGILHEVDNALSLGVTPVPARGWREFEQIRARADTDGLYFVSGTTDAGKNIGVIVTHSFDWDEMKRLTKVKWFADAELAESEPIK